MERINIYDKNRNKTNKVVDRFEYKKQNDEFDLSVQIWIINSNEEILLTQRADKMTYPYMWECTEGVVDYNESSLDAAIREVKEEIGIDIFPNEIYKLKIDKELEYPKFTDVYLCKKNVNLADIILQNEECINVKIVNEEEYINICNSNLIVPHLKYFYDIYKKNKKEISFQNTVFINEDKKYLKGNIHTHSIESDGMYSIKELAEIYDSKKYDFIGITDHDKFFNNNQQHENLVLLPGIESSCIYNSMSKEKGPYVHFNCFSKNNKSVDEILYYNNIAELQQNLIKLKEKYSLIQLNHPLFSRLTDTEWLMISGYNMIEVYNHKDYLEEFGEYSSEHLIRTLLNNHKEFCITAGDDFHGPYSQTINDKCFGGYIMVEADKNYESIISAIKNGKFYASTGPTILDYRICGREISIKTTPVERIIFYSNMRHCKNIYSKDGSEIINGSYILQGEEYYVWAKVIDKNGKTAWVQPIFIDLNPYFQ